MKRILLALPLLFLMSCGGDSDVTTPDYKGIIDDNTDRISQLEKRMSVAEADVDALELDVDKLALILIGEQDLDEYDVEDVRSVIDKIADINSELLDLKKKDGKLNDRITRVRDNLNIRITRVKNKLNDRITKVRNNLRDKINDLQIEDIEGLADALDNNADLIADAFTAISEIELLPGPKGDKGDTGLTGARGIQGFRGARGLRGYRGHRGFRGFVGSIGAIGPQGPIGPQGDVGAPGTNGLNGCILDIREGNRNDYAYLVCDEDEVKLGKLKESRED